MRRRTRLRSAKLADGQGSFLADCVIHDASGAGLRVRLHAPVDLPRVVLLFEDATGRVRPARLVWRRGDAAGLRLMPPAPAQLTRIVWRRFAADFYAVGGVTPR